jgi:lipoprotein-anchoring transpeptidase ErfK/SrfK
VSTWRRLAEVGILTLLAIAVIGTGSVASDRVIASFAAATAPSSDELRSTLPFPIKIPPKPPAPRYLIGRVLKPIATPAGVVQPITPLGSPTWVLVVRRNHDRARVLVPGMPNAKLARIDVRDLSLRWTRIAVSIDLSARRLEIKRGRKVAGSFRVAVGSLSTPTPIGRFFVTDRVSFPPGSIYGSFALGLAAHQTAPLPPSWSGGNQIAIHGTDAPSSIGQAVSLGCVRVGGRALTLLRRLVPLGAPVVIKA